MFDIGWPELLLVMVVALIVIGPKELPGAIRTVASVVRKVRGMAREFQSGLDDIARESGLNEVKREFDDVVDYDPKAALESMAENDPDLEFDDFTDPTTGNTILDSGQAGKPASPDAESDADANANAEPEPERDANARGEADAGAAAGADREAETATTSGDEAPEEKAAEDKAAEGEEPRPVTGAGS